MFSYNDNTRDMRYVFITNLVLSLKLYEYIYTFVSNKVYLILGIEFERKADISRASVDRLDRFSMYQCAHRCLRNIICFAYDYNPKSKECLLVGANTYVAKGEPCVYYEITKLIKTPQCN